MASTPDVSQFVINIIILIIFVALFLIATISTLSSRYYVRRMGRNLLTRPLPFTALENVKFKSHRVKAIRDAVERMVPALLRQDDVAVDPEAKRRNYAAAVATMDRLWNPDGAFQARSEPYRAMLERAQWSGEEVSRADFEAFVELGGRLVSKQ
ncbi:hypothetical protein SS50377_22305 [Spironucleus salmonicida]|uniref:Uncharacterized protein n=1 Tax=Spironucleus salmonicida TaxID=348837 RepID=V6LD96_9EUKA|nr:hypothetical protein SS50377_22300 [Spironucleus salmonicida]KAH0574690.1 hypothetical protein SS50377_22305 [Spironucleus salmonicida]|eukprot:EST42203.1 Hypothetical protein SS50377_18505 [Spironucleus salmonicida]